MDQQVWRWDATAVAAADRADAAHKRGDALGLLHGVPVTIKENVDQEGAATTNGVVAFKDVIATACAGTPTTTCPRARGRFRSGREGWLPGQGSNLRHPD
jgi:Asp-tRNA(Asn)/Glu-tRNA(Gln) amidotransferase A subunit family amidase